MVDYLIRTGLAALGGWIGSLLGIVTIYVLFWCLRLADRRNLLRFFGVTADNPTFCVYLSRMEIIEGGTRGSEEIKRGYQGPATSKLEYEGALLLRDLLAGKGLLILSRNPHGKWLRSLLWRRLEVPIHFSPDPQVSTEISAENLVTLGGKVYNVVSKNYLDKSNCFSFERNADGERVIRILTSAQEGQVLNRAENRQIGVIERINDSKNQRVAFVCAGLDASATFGCVRYLAEHWKTLQRLFGAGEFSLYLVFEGQKRDTDVVVRPRVSYLTDH